MSLTIEEKRVKEVLLVDGKWHQVVEGSFDTDSYDYNEQGLIPTTGATWKEGDERGGHRTVFCPMTSVQALSYGWRTKSN